ncbi:uncharacterized protein PV09_03850 [Verruconis gallopava]|uniref:AAA+ ATPase domain-containing protein n=1 Tax=Verruconis gallopava TaxID=253628 RepID=A0A0D1XRL4_9PEZI|nr:uncharacterized protein PV09_03850 [Verruconis gallopava]KIW05331.1 hypothetical protein PV09_03850 [Verruconis gallopava]
MQNAVAITNPLVLYRALVSTNRIRPDPAQLRLALHLQKLYDRLKDYEPTMVYSHRLQQLGRAIGHSSQNHESVTPFQSAARGILQSLLEEKEKRDSLALTRVLSDYEEAIKLDSPKGLMVHGEVGTGKSMLIDLFADCLPTRKKRRWHYNTFMLEIFSKLEQLRIRRLSQSRHIAFGMSQDDHSMLWLARDLVEKSPILFLDEFQLPDRASAKIMTNLMTRFFGMGGVLIATSNRMPDELAKAAGIQFVQPSARRGTSTWNFRNNTSERENKMFGGGQSEFADFLDLLKARCDIWEMEGKSDYRRASQREKFPCVDADISSSRAVGGEVIIPTNYEEEKEGITLPTKYFLQPRTEHSRLSPELEAEILSVVSRSAGTNSFSRIPWQPFTLKVYGRSVLIPRSLNQIAYLTFDELCGATLGPADYTTLASNFHTVIITHVPILTSSLKNEARRFITLLDALYEAKCKLLIAAQADPDNLFFPELRSGNGGSLETEWRGKEDDDATYAETFSEMHQDLTAPFRPNVSMYDGSVGDSTRSHLQGLLAEDALEDDPPNKVKRMIGRTDSDFLLDEQFQVQRTPNFANTSIFTGEDEKFAYKRATSRLWEMCGHKWWARAEEGWWRPLPLENRGWESKLSLKESPIVADSVTERGDKRAANSDKEYEGMGELRQVNENEDEVMFRYGGSPFRRILDEPPRKIAWTHFWGTIRWGKRAGPWGQGVDGLKDRKRKDENSSGDRN